jgi:uncharacterized SAM-binding protein YcdF (DUF218 family)
MTQLVRFVFSVGGLAVFAVGAVSWLCLRPHSRIARRAAMAVAGFYLLATVYATSFAVCALLTIGFEPLTALDLPPQDTAIVILGAGSYTIRDWSGNEYSTTDGYAASRVLEAVRVFRLIDPAWVISSGGKVRPDDRAIETGLAMRDLLLMLGVPAGRVLTETSSRNTHEEALAVAALLTRLKIGRAVIVTSDFHMRRTLGAFRAAGIHGIPAIVRDPFPPETFWEWIVPGPDALWRSDLMAHEVLGIAYYAARGWYRF